MHTKRLVLCSATFSLDVLYTEIPKYLGAVSLGDTIEREERGSSKVKVITGARVPLVKWRFEGRVDVDIVFARVYLPSAPTESEILSNSFFKFVSSDNRLHVTGLRTRLEIQSFVSFSHVPLSDYAEALRLLKYWAARRKIYGNLFTYPNGVILAIMLAKVCLCCDREGRGEATKVSFLVKKFFSYYKNVFSGDLAHLPTISIVPLDLTSDVYRLPGMPRCWKPSSASAKQELAKVINPAYPYTNSAHGMGRSSLECFVKEVWHAEEIVSSLSQRSIYDIFQPYVYPKKYQHFLAVHVRCEGLDEKNSLDKFDEWRGYLLSRLRFLIYALECFVPVRPHPFLVLPPKKRSREQEEATLETSNSMGAVFNKLESKKNAMEGAFLIALDFALCKDKDEILAVIKYGFHFFKSSLSKGYASLNTAHENQDLGAQYAFQRDEKTMVEPWGSLHTRDQVQELLSLQ